MKNLIRIIIFTCLVSCERTPDSNNGEKYFSKEQLSGLSLENIGGFWGNDSLDNYSNPFDDYSGYVGGTGLKSDEKGIGVGVAVFESQEKALECMEGRINTVACVIERGTTDEIDDIWWYSACIPNIVFKNQWNAIIEVYYYHSNFEEIKDILYKTANELAKRVDDLSE